MITKKPILIVMMLLALFACTKPEEQESPTPDDSETITDPADPNRQKQIHSFLALNVGEYVTLSK
jgi:type IV pilus biogenesis protein CpaD/CtpE